MLEEELQDTYKYIHCDTATKVDLLGFRPYAEAIAEFLTDEDTCSPLTLSIEGQWGCGKSSFMLQLEDEIKKLNSGKENSIAENKRFTIWGNSTREKKDFTIWSNSTKEKKAFTVGFNSWRYDKEDELWAAFALNLMDQLSE
jgi:predicted KAP-like P-loop ATPase